MSTDNKLNLQYFQSESMAGLYEKMSVWQQENRKRFASVDIQKDGQFYCCIALTNPTEVVIVARDKNVYQGEYFEIGGWASQQALNTHNK